MLPRDEQQSPLANTTVSLNSHDRFLICEFRGYNQQSNLLVSIVSGSEILFRFYGVERRYNKERAASSEAASNEGIRMARQPGDGSGCKIYWTRQ